MPLSTGSRRASRLIYWSALATLGAMPLTGAARAPTTMPQIRLEADMHSSKIEQIRGDFPRRRVVSISNDKTVRIWQLPSLRLVRTLHVPSDLGNEGVLFALAVSPDGRTIATGGWTGWDWDQTGTVYLFDSDSGDLLRRIDGLPSLVGTLDFSPDGRRLAVGLHGGFGLRVYDTTIYSSIAEDKEYGERVAYLEYAVDGRLATTAQDGYVRIYNAQNKLIGRQSIGLSKQLGGIRFSPDGSKLAFGVLDQPIAAVIAADTMDVLSVKKIDEPKQAGLCCIAWSRDGSYLYVNGAYTGDGPTPLYRWDGQGLGHMEILPVGNQRFTNMLPLPDGGMVFATDTPSFGLIDAQGRLVRTLFGANGDFRDGAEIFRLSDDGSELEFPLARSGQTKGQFSVRELGYGGPVSDSSHVLQPARRAAPGIRLEIRLGDEQASPAPILNGWRLALDKYETVYSYAISPDNKSVAFTTGWSLRLYDTKKGGLLWRIYLPSTGHNVNISGDGRWAVVTIADGTIRWYAMEDGREALGLFPHRNQEDWVLWRPDGYYASSVNGDRYIGWLVNRGRDVAPDFYRAVQFERQFYRPDLLRGQLGMPADPSGILLASTGSPASLELGAAGRLNARGERSRGRDLSAPELNRNAAAAPPEFSINRLAEFAPPRIKIRRADIEPSADGGTGIALEFEAEKNSRPMQEYAVYLNGIPVTRARDRQIAVGDSARFSKRIALTGYRKDNELRVEVFNGVALGLAETYVEAPKLVPTTKRPQGDLYLLAIGVDNFVNIAGPDKQRLSDLLYAGRDAVELARLFRAQGLGEFAHVYVQRLTEADTAKPNRENIIKALEFFETAGPDDTVVVFLASHGFSDAAGNFYFVPRDAKLADIDAIWMGRNKTGRADSLVSWQDFFYALRRSAGHRLLIVDTCEAQNAAGTFDARSLQKRSAASQFALMVASKGGEESQEYPAAQQGLFTYAVLEGLRGKADRNQDNAITLAEAFGYAGPLVERLRDKTVGKQTPQLMAPAALEDMRLAHRTAQ